MFLVNNLIDILMHKLGIMNKKTYIYCSINLLKSNFYSSYEEAIFVALQMLTKSLKYEKE